MIAKLIGLVDTILSEGVILDVNGVGYLVHVSERTAHELDTSHASSPESKKSLLVETLVRQEQLTLYGFLREEDQSWFRLLLTVQGVGAKVALSILSAFSAEELSSLILKQDKMLLSKAEGVGPKLASRIVSELKEKASTFPFAPSNSFASPSALKEGASLAVVEACSALVNLGYKRAEALEVIEKAFSLHEKESSVESLIRMGLSLLSRPQAAS